MATKDGYLKVYNGFCSHDNYNEVFPATFSKLSSELDLGWVKSCLMVGPGDGHYELQFLDQCVPNVSKIIAVEPDQESAECLRPRLRDRPPGVDTHMIECNIQSWQGPADRVDLVLMMHVLYYFRPSERRELFKKLYRRWLGTGGLTIVVSSSRTKCPGNANELYARLGTPMTAWEDIEADLVEVGFIKQYAHEMQYSRDFSSPDESFLRFYQKHIEQPVTLDDVRNAIKELFPDGKSDQVFYTFAVFQRS